MVQNCTGTDYIADPPMAVEPRIQVNPDMAAVEVGASRTFEATYFDDMGMAVADALVRWSVSDEEIGTVHGLSEGQVKIAARGDDVVSDSVLVSIVDDSDQVAVVRVSPSSAQLQPGETLQLTAQSSNARGGLLADKTYTWRSSDESVVSVDDSGQATALAPSQATITAAADGVASNSVRLTVPGGERTGAFKPRPGSHYICEGTAILRPGDTGALELIFADDFLVSMGPRLEVFLSTRDRVDPSSLNLGPLLSNEGTQSYALPDDADLNSYDWVIIHCVPFNVSFGFAQFR